MSSEVLPDVLSALVAVGTLSLAGVTFSLSRATRRAGVDAISPRVVVAQLWVETRPLKHPAVGYAVPRGTPWSLKRHGADLIGIRARGHLRNEGSVTALIKIEPGPDVQASPPTNPDDPGLDVPLVEQETWFVLGPGSPADFGLIWWRPVSAWAEAWQQGASKDAKSPKPPPTASTRLIVRGATGDVEDRCDLAFGGYAFVPHPQDDGWAPAVMGDGSARVPGTAPPPVTRIGLMRRSYRNRRRPWRR